MPLAIASNGEAAFIIRRCDTLIEPTTALIQASHTTSGLYPEMISSSVCLSLEPPRSLA